MAGCGYVCPQYEGKGFVEGIECDYCFQPKIENPQLIVKQNEKKKEKNFLSDQSDECDSNNI